MPLTVFTETTFGAAAAEAAVALFEPLLLPQAIRPAAAPAVAISAIPGVSLNLWRVDLVFMPRCTKPGARSFDPDWAILIPDRQPICQLRTSRAPARQARQARQRSGARRAAAS